MPIGAANNFAASTAFVAYGVFCTPSVSFTSSGPGGVTSAQVTANVTGGQAPYTYLWTRVSGDSTITISDDTAAQVTFSANSSNGDQSAIWKCTVTDDLSAVTDVEINVNFVFTQ